MEYANEWAANQITPKGELSGLPSSSLHRVPFPPSKTSRKYRSSGAKCLLRGRQTFKCLGASQQAIPKYGHRVREPINQNSRHRVSVHLCHWCYQVVHKNFCTKRACEQPPLTWKQLKEQKNTLSPKMATKRVNCQLEVKTRKGKESCWPCKASCHACACKNVSNATSRSSLGGNICEVAKEQVLPSSELYHKLLRHLSLFPPIRPPWVLATLDIFFPSNAALDLSSFLELWHWGAAEHLLKDRWQMTDDRHGQTNSLTPFGQQGNKSIYL